ncbi:hypothetical protein GCM10011512_09110 [Tersicoccus solisilvae]|uniref:Uncharacterized protein n=1 Tax=Tersicoccus solisilvae TaxID=1882339 RepID=A0ABQ1NWE7_9MICC|nr:hypothetical protein [Tersicoccus solisilvae]GGC84452.1 hypothetical protein GCM10011512_09110 [Tersicoccus solisilvae]
MTEDPKAMARSLLHDLADRPLGGAELASGRTLLPFSASLLIGAENLLAKAARAWRNDRARAERYVDRALALPFDEHEEAYPAARAATLYLYQLITAAIDELEDDDESWLDAAITVLRSSTGAGQAELRDALEDVPVIGGISETEEDRLLRAIGAVPEEPGRVELDDRPIGELRDRILAVLDVGAAFEDAFAQLRR